MFQNIDPEEFYQRTGQKLSNGFGPRDIKAVVPLTDIGEAIDITLMSNEYLRALICNVRFSSNEQERVYDGCKISAQRIDPRCLSLGQTFVQRSKLLRQIEDVPKIFAKFPIYHGAKCNAMIVYGKTYEGLPAIAHYIPPIIEVHDGRLLLLDGVHRNRLTLSVGTTIESIIIEKVRFPFPCDIDGWNKVKTVDEKPPVQERFYNLNPSLFRDLKWVGIDG